MEKKFHEILKEARLNAGLTQSQLAEKNHAKCKIVVDNLRNAWYYNIRKKQENKPQRRRIKQ